MINLSIDQENIAWKKSLKLPTFSIHLICVIFVTVHLRSVVLLFCNGYIPTYIFCSKKVWRSIIRTNHLSKKIT